MPQVEVTFDVDANGILSVKAKDKASNREQSIRIEASSGLSKDDIEKMKRDAEAHAAEDAKKKETVEAKNMAEQLIYTSEKALKDAGDKVSEDVKKPINEKIEALKKVKDGTDTEAIKKATGELSTEIQKIGQHMNQSGAQAAGGAAGATGGAGDQSAGGEQKDNVRDADFKENPGNGDQAGK
jgi:molecular chaperone DnaK